MSPVRQEQEEATTEVSEVAPGVIRTQIPIMFTGLGHVNCYVFEDEKGVAVMDPGLPGPNTWKTLKDRLRRAGTSLRHVHTVVVTHSHPDHFGLAEKLRQETGAEFVTSSRFRTWFDAAEPDVDAETEAESDPLRRTRSVFSQRTPWGGEPPTPPFGTGWRARLRRRVVRRWMLAPQPSSRLEDADVIRLAGREWVAIHTPGHTMDHLCLFDPVDGTLLSGDHVLPSITPHISGLGSSGDPLADYKTSLDKVAELEGVQRVLPAHGHPFTDLVGRVKAIHAHHEERLEKVREIGDAIGEARVSAYMRELFSERAWGDMAASETYAHLEHLRLGGQAHSRWLDGQLVYTTD